MSVIRSRYSELLKMLNSTDIDNAMLALVIIEENGIPDDLPWIIMLYKNKGISSTTWKEHSPTSYLRLGMSNFPQFSMVLSGVSLSTISDDAKKEGIEFILNEMNREILMHLHKSGYDKITGIKSTIELNEQAE